MLSFWCQNFQGLQDDAVLLCHSSSLPTNNGLVLESLPSSLCENNVQNKQRFHIFEKYDM